MYETFKAEKHDGSIVDVWIPYSARQMIEELWLDRHKIEYPDLTPDSAESLKRKMYVALNRAGLEGG
jgi:hypothetical protein